MRRHWQYLKYVTRHKWFVFSAGLRLGPPERWQWPLWIITLILHDWDKFLPDEWFPYAETFYNKDGSKRYIEFPEFAVAWMKHQKRNKHHWQAWLLTWDRGETEPLPMSLYYIHEMIADWHGAGRAIVGKSSNTADWYMKAPQDKILHADTRCHVERLLELRS